MPQTIAIIIDGETITAELNDSSAAQELIASLPIEREYATWGDEIYFSIPVNLASSDMVETVEIGDIAYWPPGSAFCIFYGLTPVSTPGDIRPASAVIPLGRVTGDTARIKTLADSGNTVRIEPA